MRRHYRSLIFVLPLVMLSACTARGVNVPWIGVVCLLPLALVGAVMAPAGEGTQAVEAKPLRPWVVKFAGRIWGKSELVAADVDEALRLVRKYYPEAEIYSVTTGKPKR